MRFSRRLGFAAFAAILASPAWAADGVGIIEDGVPSANLKGATTFEHAD